MDTLAIDRHERRLAILRELAERAMLLAKAAARRTLADPSGGDHGQAYLRLAQTVRQTIALEARLEAEGRALGLPGRRRVARLAQHRAPLRLVDSHDRPRDDEIN